MLILTLQAVSTILVASPARNHDSETQPLLHDTKRNHSVPRHAAPTRQIGVVKAVVMIFNRMIGAGVFATSSTILGLSESVGLALVMWVIRALFALCGMQVYIIWGTELPHNGGEKIYLDHLFPKPPRFTRSIYAGNAMLLAYAAENALMLAEYSLASLSAVHPSPSRSVFSLVRIVAFLCLTSIILLCVWPPSAERLQLHFLKLGILHRQGDDMRGIEDGRQRLGVSVQRNLVARRVQQCQLRARRDEGYCTDAAQHRPAGLALMISHDIPTVIFTASNVFLLVILWTKPLLV
ncbi:hypothetical protein D9619_005091 [Psilocybe cf. subviscida]|uniref:Amino acid permease/ SLC12A domain-containing protein n=1 Tax=Psilocybe cf. subviscida TaxID=2480587 RepID=A0A8H5BQG3_9AGAR|nr:hypothetical protein D9619_005091 [Psilocybe cf. subviscida]